MTERAKPRYYRGKFNEIRTVGPESNAISGETGIPAPRDSKAPSQEAEKPLDALIAEWRKRANSGAWTCADELEQALAAHAEAAPAPGLRERIRKGMECGQSEFCEHKTLEDCLHAALTASQPQDAREAQDE